MSQNKKESQREWLKKSCLDWIENLRDLAIEFQAEAKQEKKVWNKLSNTVQPYIRSILNGITLDYPNDVPLQELGAKLICTAVRLSEFAFPQHERLAWMKTLHENCDQFSDRDLAGKLLGNYGNALASAGRLTEAESVLKRRLELAIIDADPAAENVANEHLGKLLLRIGRQNEAYAILESAYETACSLNDTAAKTRLLKDVADAAFRRGENEIGIQRMQERITLAEIANDSLILFSTYHILAERLCELERLDEAEECIEHAIKLSRQMKSPRREAALLGTHGNIVLERGDVDAAHSIFLKAQRIFKKHNCIVELGMTASSLGTTSWKKGRYKQAIKWLNQAISIDRSSGRKDDLSIDLGTLGKVLVDMEDLPEAIAAYEERLEILTNLGEQDRADTTLNELDQMRALNDSKGKAKK